MKIKAFGKTISRNKACELIINDKIDEIIHAHMDEALAEILMSGWKGLEDWSNEVLQEYISEILEINKTN